MPKGADETVEGVLIGSRKLPVPLGGGLLKVGDLNSGRVPLWDPDGLPWDGGGLPPLSE